MYSSRQSSKVAIVGAGIAGAACAASLSQAGQEVTVFDKARGVGGRMATHGAEWMAADGQTHTAQFDHGVAHFGARHPRFRAALARAEVAGVVAPWRPLVHAAWPAPVRRHSWLAVPGMPALCRHLIGSTTLHLGHAVQRLQRGPDGWHLALADGSLHGPFDQVLLALPPAQAAVLLAGHHDLWADSLAAATMAPVWTLMAVTPDTDWPWDAAEPSTGPLCWVARNDHKPGRAAAGPGTATWVAHASPAWSADHLEESAEAVAEHLAAALVALLGGVQAGIRCHHRVAHRWRSAVPVGPATVGGECQWDATLGLGVCGDFLGQARGGVESAWQSGDELADTVLAWLDTQPGFELAADPSQAATV